MDELDMKRRTKEFALRAVKLADALPRTPAGKAIGGQLVRAATSVAANYRAACRARSSADFRNKLAVCEEESDESAFWIELAAEAELIAPRRLKELLDESNELTAILVASRRTSARRHNESSLNKTVSASVVAPRWGLPLSIPFTQGVALGWPVPGLRPLAIVYFKML